MDLEDKIFKEDYKTVSLLDRITKEKPKWDSFDEEKICKDIDEIWGETEEKINEKDICDTLDILHSEQDHFVDWNEEDDICTCLCENPYDLVRLVKKLGNFPTETEYLNKEICTVIRKKLIRNAKFFTDNTIFQVDIQKQVIAIAINQFIDKPEKIIGQALGINPDLFYAICGPYSTVVLLDARRWALETQFLEDEDTIWFL